MTPPQFDRSAVGMPAPRSGPRGGLAIAVASFVALLGILNTAWGFLESSTVQSGKDGSSAPMGSVFAVVGWAPALLLFSGVMAAATLLPGVSHRTAWTISAAAALAGGLGAQFFLLARPGTDAGLGWLIAQSAKPGARSTLTDSVSIGLLLLVIVGLTQAAAALLGVVLALRAPGREPRGAGRVTRPPYPVADPSLYGPGPAPWPVPAPWQGPPWPAAGPPPPWTPAAGPPPPPPSWSAAPTTAPIATHPVAPTYAVPTRTGDQRFGEPGETALPSAIPSTVAPRPPDSPVTPPEQPAPTAAPDERDAPPMSAAPDQPSGPAAPEYERTEFGSADFEWEPTYSEAPEWESRAEHDAEDEDAVQPERRERAFLYETPEWERPQVVPPLLDSARHEGWDAGFNEAGDDAGSSASRTTKGPGWRSIPRAE